MESVATRGEPVCRKEDCSPFDIGTVYKEIATFPPAQKYNFITNVWKPDTSFVFPKTFETKSRNRKFRLEWLEEYPWLVYSKYLDGALCLSCICFGKEPRFHWKRNASKCKYYLFRVPLTFWTTAKCKFKDHCNGKFRVHRLSILAMQNFLQVQGKPTLLINQQLDQVVPAPQDSQNHQFYCYNRVILCDQNNIMLRGKQDDSSNNVLFQGNFQIERYFCKGWGIPF